MKVSLTIQQEINTSLTAGLKVQTKRIKIKNMAPKSELNSGDSDKKINLIKDKLFACSLAN